MSIHAYLTNEAADKFQVRGTFEPLPWLYLGEGWKMMLPAESARDWQYKKCRACDGVAKAIGEADIRKSLEQLPGWEHRDGKIERIFRLKDYSDTAAFVNAVVWISQRENHHPTIEFDYKTCRVAYRTHAVCGISENDLICAAKVSALLEV